jgi:hypothetical protein
MRALSVIDKRTEIAFGLVLVQHALHYMEHGYKGDPKPRNDIDAENVLQKALGILNCQWELESCRVK